MNIQDWFPLGLTGLISLQSNGHSRVFPELQFKSISSLVLNFMVQLSHPYMTTGKTIALTIQAFVHKVMSLPFNMLSRFVIAFFPRSKWLNFMAVVTVCSDFGAQRNKICHCFHFFPFYLSQSDGTRCHDLSFLKAEFLSQFFCSPLSPSSRGSLVLPHFGH